MKEVIHHTGAQGAELSQRKDMKGGFPLRTSAPCAPVR
jgi:hypothetical protein